MFNQYRQAVGVFSRKLTHMDEANDKFVDLQAGHSERTAALEYARSNVDLHYLDPMSAHRFYLASKAWHKLVYKYT